MRQRISYMDWLITAAMKTSILVINYSRCMLLAWLSTDTSLIVVTRAVQKVIGLTYREFTSDDKHWIICQCNCV